MDLFVLNPFSRYQFSLIYKPNKNVNNIENILDNSTRTYRVYL